MRARKSQRLAGRGSSICTPYIPVVAPTASECLLMLNQWDGCCIGVPPTPYDAVEVRLATEMKGWKRHTINFGTIEGTFKVEPYLVENWLVGLYLFENATLNTEL